LQVKAPITTYSFEYKPKVEEMILQYLFQFGIFMQFIGPGSGRLGVTIIGLVGLLNLIIGRQALRRSALGISSARLWAIVAVVVGLVVAVLSLIHLVTSVGGFGTGNGRAGAIVAILAGLAGLVLGGLALSRTRRIASGSNTLPTSNLKERK
jgi:hypothetical protein